MPMTSVIDEILPDLPLIFELELVAQIFKNQGLFPDFPPGFDGQLWIEKLEDIKYRPAQDCIAVYRIRVEKPDGVPFVTIGVLELTRDGIFARTYRADTWMPGLFKAADKDEMFGRLKALGGEEMQAVRLLEILPIRYKPGLHCVFRYQLLTSCGEQEYFGKVFSANSDSKMENLLSLHSLSAINPALPRIIGPMAHWPELNMLVQAAIPNAVELSALTFDSSQDMFRWAKQVYRVGNSLAALHQCSVQSHERSIREDLADLCLYIPAVRKIHPRLGWKYEHAIQELTSVTADHPETALVPSHGSLRLDQILLQEDQIVIIDWDEFSLANPARDLGNFLAYLAWRAIRHPETGQFIQSAGRAFLQGYLDQRPSLEHYWLAIYQSVSLLKIAGRRFRNMADAEWPFSDDLLEMALNLIAVVKRDPAGGWPGLESAQLCTDTQVKSQTTSAVRPILPALWAALNPAEIGIELAPILGLANNPIRKATLLTNKPGRRAVIQYALGAAESEKGSSVLGKLYPNFNLCERSYQNLKFLADAVFSGQPELDFPAPLGKVPRFSMLVFLPVEGQTLNEYLLAHQLRGPEVSHAMDLTASWLALLHGQTIPMEKQFSIPAEFDNIHTWMECILTAYPHESAPLQTIVDFLLENFTGLDFDSHSPIHKDFHYEHVLVNQRVSAIDLDELRLGDPNFDLAHFCANFYLLAYRHRQESTAQFSQLQSRFLETYSSLTNWQPGDQFLFFYIYSCLKIARQLCTHRGPRPWPWGAEQSAQVRVMLGQALSGVKLAEMDQPRDSPNDVFVNWMSIRSTGWNIAEQIEKSLISSAAIPDSLRILS